MIKILCALFSFDKELRGFEEALKAVEDKLAEAVRTSGELAESLTIYESMYVSYMTKKSITEAIERCTPDMQWAKDLNGCYVYANEAIRSGLLMCPNPIGQTDLEIAGIRTIEESDAGETCFGSDLETLNEMKPMRFIEEFTINGHTLVLDVHKAPMYNDKGECIGTAGIGRDITEMYKVFTELEKSMLPMAGSRRESDNILRQLKEMMEIYNG